MRATVAGIAHCRVMASVIDVDFLACCIDRRDRPEFEFIGKAMGSGHALLTVGINQSKLSVAAVHLACGPGPAAVRAVEVPVDFLPESRLDLPDHKITGAGIGTIQWPPRVLNKPSFFMI